MPKEYTNGFDVKAQVSEYFLSDFFRMVTPPRTTRTFTHHGKEHTLEIFFHLVRPSAPVFGIPPPWPKPSGQEFVPDFPHLRLLSPVENQNLVELHFPFRVTVISKGWEKIGEAIVVVAAEEVEQSIDDKTQITIIVSLSSINPDQFKFNLFPSSPVTWFSKDLKSTGQPQTLTWSASGPGFPQSVFEQHAKPLVINTLKNHLEIAPLTPKTPAISFFAFRAYVKDFDEPHDHWIDSEMEQRFLGVFANKNESDVFLAAPPFFTPAPPPSPEPSGTNMRIMLPVELVMSILEEEKPDLPFTKEIDNGPDVTLHELNFELREGAVHVWGSANDFDFSLDVSLKIEDGEIQTKVYNVDIDQPWWLDFLEAGLGGAPAIGTIIANAIIKAIKQSLGGALGDLSSDLFSGVGVFSNDLLEMPGQLVKLFLSITNEGSIVVQTNGIVLPAQIAMIVNDDDLERPEPVFAHKQTREFHKPKFSKHKKLAKENLVRFANPFAAVGQCFNGCAYCYPDYHLDDLTFAYATLCLVLTGHTPGAEVALAVDIKLKRSEMMVIQELEVSPKLRLGGNLDLVADENGSVKISIPLDLFGGEWEVEVSASGDHLDNDESGTWSRKCLADFPPRKSRYYMEILFNVGSTEEGCQVRKLAIPAGSPMAIGKLRISCV